MRTVGYTIVREVKPFGEIMAGFPRHTSLANEIQPIVSEQGWTDATVLDLALRYIEGGDELGFTHPRTMTFPEFLRKTAEQENSAASEV